MLYSNNLPFREEDIRCFPRWGGWRMGVKQLTKYPLKFQSYHKFLRPASAMRWNDLQQLCRFMRDRTRGRVRVYKSLKWAISTDSLQTAVLFTSCYPATPADGPTKDDRVEKPTPGPIKKNPTLQVPGHAACWAQSGVVYTHEAVQSRTSSPKRRPYRLGVNPFKLCFLLVSTTRINPELSFSSVRKVCQMGGGDNGSEWKEGNVGRRESEREGSNESRYETSTADLRTSFSQMCSVVQREL